MNRLLAPENRHWLLAGGMALVAHVTITTLLVLADGAEPVPEPEQPVVLIELPPLAAPPPAPQVAQEATPEQPDYVPPQIVTPRVEAPRVDAPLPREVVAAAPPPPAVRPAVRPSTSAPRAAPASPPAPASTGTAAAPAAGTDARATAQEADYISLVNSHLARRKRYPSEARQARQQGVVTVRFTVNSDGSVTNSSIRNSSGHELLDQATLDLLQRVSPLPRFPRSMTRSSITLTLPIEYSLQTR